MERKDQSKIGNALECRTVTIGNQPLQLRIEPSYWQALDEICERECLTLNDLCSDIYDRLSEQTRRQSRRTETERVSLANAVRIFTVGYFRQAATESGHHRAGHGRGDPFVATPFDAAPLSRSN